VLGETKQKTRILLVDDHHMVRQGIRQLLEHESDFQVVGEADNGQSAVKLARETKPDVIVMEVRISKVDSVEIVKRVKSEHPKAKVLILTSLEDEEYIVTLFAAGASGHLLKCADGEELVQAIRAVHTGECVYHPLIAQKVFNALKYVSRQVIPISSAEHLTRREVDVLKLAAKGLSTRCIAGQLNIGPRTVKHHLMSIFSKMSVSSRTEAVLTAIKRGWLTLDDK